MVVLDARIQSLDSKFWCTSVQRQRRGWISDGATCIGRRQFRYDELCGVVSLSAFQVASRIRTLNAELGSDDVATVLGSSCTVLAFFARKDSRVPY